MSRPNESNPESNRQTGQILVTDTVRNLVAGKNYRFSDHGTHDLKGFEEPARLFELGWESA